MAERYLDVHQVALRLRCDKRLIYRAIRNGRLKAVKVGKRSLRIAESDYLEFVNRSLQENGSK